MVRAFRSKRAATICSTVLGLLPVLLCPLGSALLPTDLCSFALCLLSIAACRLICLLSAEGPPCLQSPFLLPTMPLSHALHYTGHYNPLSFLASPRCGHCTLGFATLSTSTALKIPACLASRLHTGCLIRSPCGAFYPMNCLQLSIITLNAGAPAARATCVGCVARRLKQAHIGRPTRITGILSPPVMEGRMMPGWTMPG